MVRKARTNKLSDLRSQDRTTDRAVERRAERLRKESRKFFRKGEPAWWYSKERGLCLLTFFYPPQGMKRSSGGSVLTPQGSFFQVSNKFLVKTAGYPTFDQSKDIRNDYWKAFFDKKEERTKDSL